MNVALSRARQRQIYVGNIDNWRKSRVLPGFAKSNPTLKKVLEWIEAKKIPIVRLV
jgi:hypothetical protein